MNLFNRKIEVIIEGLNGSLNYPDLEISFEGDFDSNPDPNIYKVTIYNLNKDTISQIKKNSKIIVNAGYENDIGCVVAGRIKEAITKNESIDTVTNIEIYDLTTSWLNTVVNKSFKGSIKASQVISSITGGLGIEIGKIELAEDKVYQLGKTVLGKLSDVLKTIIVTECKSNLIVRDGRIDIVPYKNNGFETGFVLNADTGLIASPTKIDSQDIKADYTVKMLFNYHIKSRSLIQIESKVVSGLFVVIEGKHDKNFETEVSVKAVG